MKRIIEIDDKSTTGKRIVRHLKSIAQRNKVVSILTSSSLQAKEDAALARFISAGLKSGITDKSRVLKNSASGVCSIKCVKQPILTHEKANRTI